MKIYMLVLEIFTFSEQICPGQGWRCEPGLKYFTDRSKAVLLLWILYAFFCLVLATPLCASVYLCLVVTCWERVDLLALVCGV